MKILYLGFNSFKQHKRGVENVIEFQSKALEFDRIYYLHWGPKTTAYKVNNFACISVKHCWYWPLILNIVLFRIRKRSKFIIHSHNPLFSFFSTYKTDILTVHDGLYYLTSSKKQRFKVVFWIIEYLLYYRCSLVHFISNYTKEQTLFGNRKDFVIIPNTSHFESFVKLNVFPQNKIDNKISVLIVRSIEERARFDLLLQVAEELSNQDYLFVVAGKGPLLENYKNEILNRKITNIQMLGFVGDADLLNLYSSCDLVLMIAEYGEGFGLPIIEGYLFDKPVIASNRCAIPEVIISEDFLFENNVDSIIKSIDFTKRNQLQNFRSYYESKYSNAIILSQMRKLYSSFHL
ncbi:MAG: glycosyltransferase family 4 protein [Bacteroidales bacterium]|nr:glycosyltransferase family 4 protein [Bacteroidales bacterium]